MFRGVSFIGALCRIYDDDGIVLRQHSQPEHAGHDLREPKMTQIQPDPTNWRPGARALQMSPREPTTAPCATERSRLHMLLIAANLFVPLSTWSEMRASSSRSDQVGPLPLLFTPPRTRAPAPKSGFVPVKLQRVTAKPTLFHIITTRFGFSAMLESPGRAKTDPVSSENARFTFATHAKGSG